MVVGLGLDDQPADALDEELGSDQLGGDLVDRAGEEVLPQLQKSFWPSEG